METTAKPHPGRLPGQTHEAANHRRLRIAIAPCLLYNRLGSDGSSTGKTIVKMTRSRGVRALPLAPALLALLLLGSCSESTVAPRRGEISSEHRPAWTWLNPLPQGNTLLAVWGSSADDVYAVGERGAIVHFDGSKWTAMESGTIERLWDVMGSSSSRIWAVGGNGEVLFKSGRSWTEKEIGTTKTLYSVWVNRDGTVYACGAGGIVLKNDGWSWSILRQGGSVLDHMNIWADEDGEVFTASYYTIPDDQAFFGALLYVSHYDGISWTTTNYMESRGVSLRGIWGSGPRDVYFVGSRIALHYDGEKLASFRPNAGALLDIWGITANDIFAVGASGAAVRYDGSAWNSIHSGTGASLYGVWGSSGSDVYAVGDGGIIRHFDGAEWTESGGQAVTRRDVNDLWGLSGSDVYAVGVTGLIAHFDGSAWSLVNGGTSENLKGVWASSSTDVFAVGENGTILRGDASSFGAVASPTGLNLWDVHGSSPTDVYAVAGEGNAGQVLHFDGTSWSVVFESPVPLYSVWEVLPTEVYAIGSGTVCSFDGSQWVKEYWSVQRGLWARGPDDVYAIGNLGIYHFDGTAWRFLDPPQPTVVTTYPLTGLWGYGEDIYAVGPYYNILHYDGSEWETMESPSNRLGAIWGSGADTIVFAGKYGDIIRYGKPE